MIVPIKVSTWNKGPKYRPGPVLERIDQVVEAFRGRWWLYYGGVVKHPSIIANMSLSTIMAALHAGRIRYAIPTEASRYYRSDRPVLWDVFPEKMLRKWHAQKAALAAAKGGL